MALGYPVSHNKTISQQQETKHNVIINNVNVVIAFLKFLLYSFCLSNDSRRDKVVTYITVTSRNDNLCICLYTGNCDKCTGSEYL